MAGLNTSFIADISRFVSGEAKERARILKKCAVLAYQGITTRTPVKTGRARANWRCAISQPDTATDENVVLDGTRALTAFQNVEPQMELCISNSLPYVEGLERGRSSQAPAGMVAVTVEDIKNKLETGGITGD